MVWQNPELSKVKCEMRTNKFVLRCYNEGEGNALESLGIMVPSTYYADTSRIRLDIYVLYQSLCLKIFSSSHLYYICIHYCHHDPANFFFFYHCLWISFIAQLLWLLCWTALSSTVLCGQTTICTIIFFVYFQVSNINLELLCLHQ